MSENVWDKRGGVSRFSVEKFGLTVPKNFIGEDFWAVFLKISGSENFMDKRGGGVSGFPVAIFLSHSDRNFLGGTLLCFAKLPILKNVRDKRWCDSQFSVESFFVSECRKNSERNPSVLCFRKLLVAKFLWIRGGGGVYQDFPSKFFCLTVTKIFLGEPFFVSQNFR